MGQQTLMTAAAASLLTAAAAHAALSADMASFNLIANGSAVSATNSTTNLGDGRFAHSGFWAANGMLVQWNNLITSYTVANGVETAYISGGFVVKNNSASTGLVLDLSVLMGGAMGAGTYTGSAGGQAVNFGFSPGSFGSVGGAPIWGGSVNGSVVGGVLTATQSVNPFSLGSFAPQSFGGSMGSVNSGMGLSFRLTLAAGMESSFSGAFSTSAVPAPGAIALVGMTGASGLLGWRRRR